jgi:hypothetical protein
VSAASTTGIITAPTISTGIANEDTDDEEPVESIVTADEFLELGLGIFFDVEQLRNVKKSTNLDRFVAHYGCVPRVCAMLWKRSAKNAGATCHGKEEQCYTKT